jgi:hypothetical protein
VIPPESSKPEIEIGNMDVDTPSPIPIVPHTPTQESNLPAIITVTPIEKDKIPDLYRRMIEVSMTYPTHWISQVFADITNNIWQKIVCSTPAREFYDAFFKYMKSSISANQQTLTKKYTRITIPTPKLSIPRYLIYAASLVQHLCGLLWYDCQTVNISDLFTHLQLILSSQQNFKEYGNISPLNIISYKLI